MECLFAGNGNGLLYCILFMIYIDSLFFCTVKRPLCHFPTWIQISIFQSTAIPLKLSLFFPAENSSSKLNSDSTVGNSFQTGVCAKTTLGHRPPRLLPQWPVNHPTLCKMWWLSFMVSILINQKCNAVFLIPCFIPITEIMCSFMNELRWAKQKETKTTKWTIVVSPKC